MQKTYNTLARRLQFIMEKYGYTHNDVARMCSVKQGSVSYILSKNLDKSKLANDLADGLKISYEWLTTGKGTIEKERIYKIPLFDNLFDCIKYKNNTSMPSQHHVYSNLKALSNNSFALQLGEKLTILCSFCSEQINNTGLYLNINSLINGQYCVAKNQEGEFSFPIVEMRVQGLSKEDFFKIEDTYVK